ncbi:hypothetical protein SLS56_003755 [Neofusicoccum ribis]|uniref:Nicotinamide N-methyltransferase n=1 Tax=Neofusicoccum ribis TaxID=45134 RepID=A0ABR3SYD7_9PEZI
MLTSLLRVTPRSPTADPEDVFSAALGTLFTDDLRNQHGDPGAVIAYLSRRLDRALNLAVADPAGEEERKKFAHYLWNAGVLMAELVGGRPAWEEQGDKTERLLGGLEWRLEGGSREWWVDGREEQVWRVEGERVVISDYPAPEILENLEKNVKTNVPETLRSKVSVQGHLWGDLTSPFSVANAGRFTRILAADCLWMPHEHHSLAKSMLHSLSPAPEARVLVIAGFHTGRASMAPFFKIVEEEGLKAEDIYEMDAEGRRRDWAFEKDGGREDHGERNKWLVIAQLKRKQ